MIDSTPPSRRLRLVELALVLFVAFAPAFLQSAYALAGRQLGYGSVSTSLLYLTGVISQVGALAVLCYVLFRQGRSLQAIGFGFKWRDLPVSLGLFLAAVLFTWLWQWGSIAAFYAATRHAPNTQAHNVEFLRGGVNAASLIFVLLNPFFEELIVRAYVISEVTHLTGKVYLAVILSVLFQASYHLYQGTFLAWSYIPLFLIFSLYYAARRRITPVILAHLYFDLLALLAYPRG
ncbi:MAG: CPBP family intramembrane glutamic endopeptidase [Pyrinomonadaceae bacterium]